MNRSLTPRWPISGQRWGIVYSAGASWGFQFGVRQFYTNLCLNCLLVIILFFFLLLFFCFVLFCFCFLFLFLFLFLLLFFCFFCFLFFVFVVFFFCGQDNLPDGHFWATGRFNLLGGQNNILGGQMPSQLTCYLPPCAKNTQKLQTIQNRAARLVLKANRREHTTPLLKELHWLLACEQINYESLTLAYKSKHTTTPPYVQNLIKPHKFYDGNMFLRSHADDDLFVSKRTHTIYGDNAFCNSVLFLWNKLPKALRTSHSLATFKTNLKTYLFPKWYCSEVSRLINYVVHLCCTFIVALVVV